jgi:hypothetical protein
MVFPLAKEMDTLLGSTNVIRALPTAVGALAIPIPINKETARQARGNRCHRKAGMEPAGWPTIAAGEVVLIIVLK